MKLLMSPANQMPNPAMPDLPGNPAPNEMPGMPELPEIPNIDTPIEPGIMPDTPSQEPSSIPSID